MYLKQLELTNFRNYEFESLEFSKGLNVIYGENAQGKTNLIEAIYLLSTGGSPRVTSDKELIMFGAERARVFGDVVTERGDIDLEMILSLKEKKRVSINSLSIAKIGELISNLNAIYFSPDEMRLIKNSPEYRRKFMDVVLSQLSRAYFYMIGKYNKILKQRNSLLKKEDKKTIMSTLEIWDEQLASEGAKIINQRMMFCDKLSKHASLIHEDLTKSREKLFLEYESSCKGESVEEIRQLMIKKLDSALERDIRLGYTSVGPQRDDIKIALEDIDIRTYGSQGQQRTATLAMKIAEVELFKEVKGDSPILLLDDVLSELDDIRQTKLLEKARELQTIITTTSTANIKDIDKKILIQKGKVKYN